MSLLENMKSYWDLTGGEVVIQIKNVGSTCNQALNSTCLCWKGWLSNPCISYVWFSSQAAKLASQTLWGLERGIQVLSLTGYLIFFSKVEHVNTPDNMIF